MDKNFSVQAVGIRMAYNCSPYRTGLKKYSDVSRVLNRFNGLHSPTSSDFISSYASTVARASDIVEFVRSIPADYCSSANKSMVEDMQHFCGVSEARARDILNRSGMKGFVDEVRDKLIAFDGSDDPGDQSDPDVKFPVPVYSDFSNFLI